MFAAWPVLAKWQLEPSQNNVLITKKSNAINIIVSIEKI
jgi:hypothetical protein